MVLRSELAALLAAHGRRVRGGRRLAEEAARISRPRTGRARFRGRCARVPARREVRLRAGLPSAHELLGRAAAYRSRSVGAGSGTGWYARAEDATCRRPSRGVLVACRRGLERSRSTQHAGQLGAEGAGDPPRRRALLALAAPRGRERAPHPAGLEERRRATHCSQPTGSPSGRCRPARNHSRPCATPDAGWPRHGPRARPPRPAWTTTGPGWSEAIVGARTTWRARRSSCDTVSRPSGCSPRSTTTAFVELVDIDGTLHALVARAGQVRHVVVGGTDDAERGGRVRPVRAAADGPGATLGPRRRRASAAGGAAGGRRTSPR